jgi:hypothetical protein
MQDLDRTPQILLSIWLSLYLTSDRQIHPSQVAVTGGGLEWDIGRYTIRWDLHELPDRA